VLGNALGPHHNIVPTSPTGVPALTTAPEQPFAISVIPPDDWHKVDLHPDKRQLQVLNSLQPLRYQLANWDTAYPLLRDYLLKTMAQAWETGMRYQISTKYDPSVSAASQLMANFTISFLPRATTSGSTEDELDKVLEMLFDEQQQLSDEETLEISRVELPNMGPAVQAARVGYVPTPDGVSKSARIATLRTFIPAGRYTVLAQGTSPQTDIAHVLFQIFAAITTSISPA